MGQINGKDYGPNMVQLILMYSARFAIPDGGGIADGVRFFVDDEYRKGILARAERFALDNIATVISAPDNPWGEDKEAIAGEIIRRVNERKQQNARYAR